MSPSRRSFCAAIAVPSVAVSLAGCSSNDVHVPSDQPGQPDIQLKNCRSESVTVQVTVTYVETGETVYDDSHSVPGDYCSDMGPSYYLEEVWTDPGEYRIRAEASGVGSDEATVELSKSAVEDDSATRSVRIDSGVTVIT